MSDEIRDQINDIIEGEIQNNINEYLESEKTKDDSGVGFVGDQAKELKVNVSNEEIDIVLASTTGDEVLESWTENSEVNAFAVSKMFPNPFNVKLKLTIAASGLSILIITSTLSELL